ncbi:MAG: aldehyde dehydrogenase family protein [Paracoccus sp. (in: a-proteobacteria)]|uniref:aldehyde dehydrogenase family protein n=1 Tax=Paracoccus sp. TaxID=267 RepID=UPI0039E6AC45
MTTEHRLLIDGELLHAEGGRVFENENPATEEIAGTAPDASAADAERAVLAARRAFDATDWSRDAAFRRAVITRFAELLQDRLEDIRPALIAESGMPVGFAKMLGVDPAIPNLLRYLDMADQIHGREIPPATIFGRNVRRQVRREAVGVVVAITPWNVPFELNLRKVGQALVTGNTVVLKPAPQTPWSATLIAEAAVQAGFPPGVLNILTTADNAVAGALTAHPAVDQITFTGSTETGRRIMATAAATVKRVGLELGGKSPAILLDDAPAFEATVKGIAGGVCTIAGQGCTLLTRLLVPRARMDEAAQIAADAVAAVRYGDPTDPTVSMGPLVNAAQRERVLGYMEAGKREARLIAGGGRAEQFERGYFVQPTIFADVPPDAVIAKEEIFGPVLSIIAHDGDDDAIRIANDSIFGLSSAVFGTDPARIEHVTGRLRAGIVTVNGAPWFDVASPFGGYKQSGLGREFGHEGLEEFTEIKTVALPA